MIDRLVPLETLRRAGLSTMAITSIDALSSARLLDLGLGMTGRLWSCLFGDSEAPVC